MTSPVCHLFTLGIDTQSDKGHLGYLVCLHAINGCPGWRLAWYLVGYGYSFTDSCDAKSKILFSLAKAMFWSEFFPIEPHVTLLSWMPFFLFGSERTHIWHFQHRKKEISWEKQRIGFSWERCVTFVFNYFPDILIHINHTGLCAKHSHRTHCMSINDIIPWCHGKIPFVFCPWESYQVITCMSPISG